MADQELEIRGEPGLKKMFSALWASVWSRNKGGGGASPPPGSSPGSPTAVTVTVSPVGAVPDSRVVWKRHPREQGR